MCVFVYLDIYEVRVHEEADLDTKATLSETLEKKLRENKNCFGQFEINDIDWLDFDSARLTFVVNGKVPQASSLLPQGTLFLMCANNHVLHLPISVHVTRINRHSPTFLQSSYQYYVPVSMPVGSVIEVINVVDHDPIIYNSQISLSIIPSKNKDYFSIEHNGTLRVAKPLDQLELYKAINMTLVAMDYGSPQLFTATNITIIPVTVSEPMNVRVNFANSQYQIFEWDQPVYGSPDSFQVILFHNNLTIQQKNVNASKRNILFMLPLDAMTDYHVEVVAVHITGQSRSRRHKFNIQTNPIKCNGICSAGGSPMCFYSQFMRPRQYEDETGPHCVCYHGFTSRQCDVRQYCHEDVIDTAYGRMKWPSRAVNHTVELECPYSSDGEKTHRKCLWNANKRIPKWQPISETDICRKQSSVLIHLGVLANYAEKNAQTISGIEAVQRFLKSVLKFPAFNASAGNFDNEIAQNVAFVLDIVLSRNISELKGNTSELASSLLLYTQQFATKLPINHGVESRNGGIQFKTFEWVADALSFGTKVGPNCFLQMPTSYKSDVVRSVCIKNTTFYDPNHNSLPIFNVFSDLHSKLPSSHRLKVGIKVPSKEVNYTCAYFNEKTKEWSRSGMTVIDRQFEDSFILCESNQLGIFTLLPESYFENKSSYLSLLLEYLPLFTNATFVICSLALLFIVLIQKLGDPAFIFLLLLTIFIHIMQIVLITVSDYSNIQKYDKHCYLACQFALISISILVAFINNAIYIQNKEISDHTDNSTTNTSPAPISFSTTYGYAESVTSASSKDNATYRPGIDTIDLYPNMWKSVKRGPLVSLV
uniref:CA domain-containing protein n=1 Tax=Rhabditophanes sp. KR3021 TaxID=114890 RepID=A0AC35UE04_9BILA